MKALEKMHESTQIIILISWGISVCSRLENFKESEVISTDFKSHEIQIIKKAVHFFSCSSLHFNFAFPLKISLSISNWLWRLINVASLIRIFLYYAHVIDFSQSQENTTSILEKIADKILLKYFGNRIKRMDKLSLKYNQIIKIKL